MRDEIVVDGVTYRRHESSAGERLRLVIVDNRGLTFVGRCDLSGDAEQIIIYNARCVIRWGTNGHLAELVAGPTDETVLGVHADVVVFRRHLVAAYVVCEEGWQ